MANRYWIGGTGNWTDTSHWSTSSGGGGGASVPTSSDDAIINAASSSGAMIVTFVAINPVAQSLTVSGNSFSVTFNKDPAISIVSAKIYGSMYLNNVTNGSNVEFVVMGTGTITQTGSTGGSSLRIKVGDLTGGNVTLASSLVANDIAVLNGSFNSAGYTINSGQIQVGSSATVSGDFTNSSITVGNWNVFGAGATTLITTNATLTVNGGFRGGSKSYSSVVLSTTATASITGSATISSLSVSVPGKTLSFTPGSVITVTTFTALNGSFSNSLRLRSSSPGSTYTLSSPSGTINGQYLDIQDSIATGGATFNAIASTNSGNNTGWNFVGPYFPVASFTQSSTGGIRPLTVNFTDTSSGPPTSWLWNFGDGTTSTSQNPSKTYSSAGTYTVSLQATNSLGSNTVTKTNLITTTVETFNRSATGTIIDSGIVTRTLRAFRLAQGTIVNSGSVSGVVLRDPQGIEEKRYLYKVYDEDDSYIETWSDVVDLPEFTHEINELGSTMTVTLARNSDSLGITTSPLLTEAGTNLTTDSGDNILVTTESRNQVGEGSSVQHNNRVDVIVFYGEVDPLLTENGMDILTESGEQILATTGAPNGRRIFTGFISEINSRYGNTETTVVQLSSYGFDLNQFVLTNVSDETTVTFNTTDPSVIAQDVMDRFEVVSSAVQTSYTHRTSTSISLSGTVVSYTFKVNSFGDVMKKILELLPSNWYFYVGLGDNTIYFRERASTPSHTFFLGKHIKALDLKSSILDVNNDVYFTGGGDPALFIRTTETPAPRTRRGLALYSDSRVTVEASAQIISDGTIEEDNKIKYRSTIEILTKVYDIESIEVGDVIAFRNFGNFVDALSMQVVGRSYTPDVVQLQLDTKPPTVNKRLSDIQRNLVVSDNQNVPIEPT